MDCAQYRDTDTTKSIRVATADILVLSIVRDIDKTTGLPDNYTNPNTKLQSPTTFR